MEQRKGSAAAIVIGLIAVVVIGLGVFYVVSDPFSSKVDRAIEGATEWTSQRIQEDPVGYLSWALSKTEQTEKDYKAARIGIVSKIKEYERKMGPMQSDMTAMQTKLDEAKKLYKSTTEWPVTIKGREITEANLKTMIVSQAKKVEQKQKVVNQYTKIMDKLQKKDKEVTASLVKIEAMKEELNANLEIARANESVAGIEGISDKMNAIFATSDALTQLDDDSSDIDTLFDDDGASELDADFDAIMGN